MKSLAIILALLLGLLFGLEAQATAPRISAQLFGAEKKAEVIGYELPADKAAHKENQLAAALVQAAFEAGGEKPVYDNLPSRQLARYALFNHDAEALVGLWEDESEQRRQGLRIVTFYLGSDGARHVVFFGKTGARAAALHRAFLDGLKKLVQSGEYRALLERHLGSGVADPTPQLKKLNPDWK